MHNRFVEPNEWRGLLPSSITEWLYHLIWVLRSILSFIFIIIIIIFIIIIIIIITIIIIIIIIIIPSSRRKKWVIYLRSGKGAKNSRVCWGREGKSFSNWVWFRFWRGNNPHYMLRFGAKMRPVIESSTWKLNGFFSQSPHFLI